MNKWRKAKRALQIGDHYFFRKHNDLKAIENYKRAMTLHTRYKFCEQTLTKISKSFFYLGNLEKALDYIDKTLEYSPGYLDATELKGEILAKMGKEKESAKYTILAKKIKKETKDMELDLDKFYKNN